MKLIKKNFHKMFLSTLVFLFMGTHMEINAQNIRQMEVVYSLPNMDKVHVQKGVIYKKANGNELSIDIYYPPSIKNNEKLPVIIFVLGYPEFGLKNTQQYISWGKLTALNDMVAINYETIDPEEDIADLINYLRKNADVLNIDENRIGIWSCSANVPVALSYLYGYQGKFIKFAVLYYGIMPTNDLRFQDEINAYSKKVGFMAPQIDEQSSLPVDLPLFIVRAGQDDNGFLNHTIKHFLFTRLSINAPLTFINYKNGHHAFDLVDDTIESRRIIKQTLGFMRRKMSTG